MPSFKQSMDKFFTRASTYMYRRFHVDHRRHRPLEIVYERAAEQSADFILSHLKDAVLFDARPDYWNWLLTQLPANGLVMECGVFEGQSINHIADTFKAKGDTRTVDGFDSFEGLEENWSGENLASGFFDRKGVLPSVRSNVTLHKGWVQETVEPFLSQNSGQPLALLHIDTDTYSPARYLLDTLKPRMVTGSIIAFDELIGYPNWQAHEFKALTEALAPDGYSFIAFTSRQAAIRIK